MVEVSASLLSLKSENTIQTLYNLETAKIDYFHIDVMDGEFVENNTVSKMTEYCEYLSSISNLPLDVHLMVEDIKEAIDDFLALEPNIITFHLEACKDKEEVWKMIQYIKDNGCKVGISVKPNTRIEEVYEFLPYIHMCLIMTVEPGKGGQTFLTDMVHKIEKLKKQVEEQKLELDIEVDGGINLKTAPAVKKAGANVLVAGTAIVLAKDFKVIIDELKEG